MLLASIFKINLKDIAKDIIKEYSEDED